MPLPGYYVGDVPILRKFILNKSNHGERTGRKSWARSDREDLPEGERSMKELLRALWRDEQGQDIAEYAVMLAVILVIVVGTIRLVGSSSNNVFSNVSSTLQ